MTFLSSITLSCRSKPVRPSFIFRTQIKIFLMKSESFLMESKGTTTFNAIVKILHVTSIIWAERKLKEWLYSTILLLHGQKTDFIKKQTLNLCFEDEWRSYGFETWRRWVNIIRALWFQRCRKRGRNPVIKRNLQFNAECHGICQSLDQLIKSRSSLHLNQIMIWTSICKY